jgi:isoleucyl-tRNA synthetase
MHGEQAACSFSCRKMHLDMCIFLQAVQRFAVTELSNFYLDVAKDRLYVRSASSPDRRY